MILHSIIIDDEPLARKGLKEYIQDVDFLRLEGVFEHPLKAVDTLVKLPIDLIFLDIQMPKISGLDFLKTLSNPPMVIFTTAYPQFAVDGFELNAVDYLLKPFSFERFWKAVIKARTQKETNRPQPFISSGAGLDYFFIKADNKLIRIQYDEILYAEALQNYVAIHTVQKKFITYLTFKSLEAHLPAEHFLKIHKSYIVNLSRIESIEGNEVKIGSASLPISRSSRDEVMQKLLSGRYLKR